MALANTDFRSVPKGVREWGRFFAQITVIPDEGSVGSAEIGEDAVTSAKIADSNVTLAKLQDITANRILGRLSTSGAPQELTAAQAIGLLQAESWVFSGTVELDGSVQVDGVATFNNSAAFTNKVGFYGTSPINQPAHVTDAETSHALNSTFDDTEVEAALNALGGKINAVIAVLESLGLKASS